MEEKIVIQLFFRLFFWRKTENKEGTSFSQDFSCGLLTCRRSCCFLLWVHSSKWELHFQGVSCSFPSPACQIFPSFPLLLPCSLHPFNSFIPFFSFFISQQWCRLLSGNFPLLSLLLPFHFPHLVGITHIL